MLLLAVQDRVTLFAGIYDAAISSAQFVNFLALDGVALTARRDRGKTLFVQLSAPSKDSNLTIKVQGMPQPWVIDPPHATVQQISNVEAFVQLSKGDTIVIKSASTTADELRIQDHDVATSLWNLWGKKPRRPLPSNCSLFGGDFNSFKCMDQHCWGATEQVDCGSSLAEPALTCDPRIDGRACVEEAAG